MRLFLSVAGRMHVFLPSALLIVALMGAHMTEDVLQEIFWTLLKDICIFRKKRIHDFCLGGNAEQHQRVFLVREISGIRELAHWLPVASKPKEVKEKKLQPLISHLKTHTVTKIDM